MDPATLWRTRVTWALVGAGVTLAITGLGGRDGGSGTEVRVAGAQDGVTDAQDGVAGAQDGVADAQDGVAGAESRGLAVAVAGSTTAQGPLSEPWTPLANPQTPLSTPQTPVSTPQTPSAAAETGLAADSAPSAASGAGDAFEIPLPMMPGARVMKRGQRPDEEHGGTIHTLSVSVPAPGAQVEAFYRSALADAKLVVTGGSTERATMGGGHRSSLRGRGREASVHVNLQQRAGTLRTIVRIIWRTLP